MPTSSAKLHSVRGAPSWRVATDTIEAWVTRAGGHLGPVTFRLPQGKIQPFAVAPWAAERLPAGTAGVLRTLRGDFFCAPFGGNEVPWRGERHPAHGETAAGRWRLLGVDEPAPGAARLRAEIRPRVRPGRVVKSVELRRGETNLYCRHVLEGFTGPMCLGHHAMLQFPPEAGSGRIALSPYREGQVCPEPFEQPAGGGYSSLRTAGRFRDLRRVPLAAGGFADLTRYPAREGFEDLVMVVARPGTDLAWTTVAFPAQGYLWFALKDPRILTSTVLWHSHGGRHYPPWRGRHRGVLGLEEVTSYFHFGLARSVAANPLSRRAIPTTLRLSRDRPLTVNYIMGLVPITRRFDRVRSLRVRGSRMVLEADSGVTATHAVDVGFLDGAER